ncbi:MAG: 2-oxoacid:acceptor oxidoreductase subunit alpha [Patescibacteria group bacterium]
MQHSETFLWKIGAPAGFGVMTTGVGMSKLTARHGYHLFDYTEYPSLIQGGHNTYEVHISADPIKANKKSIDCLICLNEDTWHLHRHRLEHDSLLVFDPQEFDPKTSEVKNVPIPFQQLLNDLKAPKIALNMVSLGASLALLGGDISYLDEMIDDQFRKKSEEIVAINQAAAGAGYTYAQEHFGELCRPVLDRSQVADRLDEAGKAHDPLTVLAGNDAFSLGAIAADARFYAAYPMSPSSSVIAIMAAWAEKQGLVARHAEDEIGVINEALGAAHVGARASVGTSGGGFALMVESLSYAGVAEIPIVVFLAQRPGPATGMPTWTEQGDLLFAAHGGHGEFPKIILAPGDIEEMLALTPKAFNLADIYQTPVVILSDKLLSESHHSVPASAVHAELSKHAVDRGKTISEKPYPDKKYMRYADSPEDGISPRLLPGAVDAFYQANSYEHLADSHTTEDAADRVQQVDKRSRKMTTYLETDFASPEVFGSLEEAQIALVSWGGNKGAIWRAQALLAEDGIKTAFIHFTHVYPLNAGSLKPFFAQDLPYLLIENNSTGQFGQLLRQQTGIDLPEKLLKYDGRPIFPEEIEKTVLKLLSTESQL